MVHINAGIAGLVGCLVIGPRIGYKTEPMPPHSLVMTMIGASLLWVGWFGFNAGSDLEANAFGALAFINTFVATAAAGADLGDRSSRSCTRSRRCSARPRASVAGLVAITPAAGFAHPGTAILLGVVASVVCFFFVTTVKNKLGYDDSARRVRRPRDRRHRRRDRHRHRRRPGARRPGLDRLHRARRRGRRVRHGAAR